MYNDNNVVFISIDIAASTSGGVYQFHGNPYTEGPLPVDAITLTEIFDSAPSHMIGSTVS